MKLVKCIIRPNKVDEVREAEGFTLATVGIDEMTDTEEDEFVAAVAACADPREMLVSGFAQGMPDGTEGCLDDDIDDDIAGEMLVAVALHGERWADEAPTLVARITDEVEPCLRAAALADLVPAAGLTPDEAFAQSATVLARAGTWAYTGTAHWTPLNPTPGGFTGADISVHGDVELPERAREVRGTSDGAFSEVSSANGAVIARSASSEAELADAVFDDITTADATADTAFYAGPPLAAWVASAQGAEAAGLDAAGRTAVRGTVAAEQVVLAENVTAGDANLQLALTPEGVPASVELTTIVGTSQVRLVLELSAIGEPLERPTVADAQPESVTEGATVQEVADAGIVGALELSTVPDGWALVAIEVAPNSPRPGCARLNLDYEGPGRSDYLYLDVATAACARVPMGEDPYTLGPWVGTAVDEHSGSAGTVADATLSIEFLSSLGLDDVSTLLTTLEPFDPATPPVPDTALPSS